MAVFAAAVGGAWGCTFIIGNNASLFWPILAYIVGGGVICVMGGLLGLPKWIANKRV